MQDRVIAFAQSHMNQLKKMTILRWTELDSVNKTIHAQYVISWRLKHYFQRRKFLEK